jgi:hypothetical protein
VTGHLAEDGTSCVRHACDADAYAQLALVGSRSTGFNHDIASKLQGVMMAIDEISELATTPEIQRAAATAHTSLGELNQLLQHNRALTKQPPPSARIEIGELVRGAASRVGVTLEAPVTGGAVQVPVQLVTQALSLVIDAAAGRERRRRIQVAARCDAQRIELELPLAASASVDGTSLAIASWVLARQGGELRCGDQRLLVRLPSAS